MKSKKQSIAQKIFQQAQADEKEIVDISTRGGGVGLRAGYLIEQLASNGLTFAGLENYLPRCYGAGCNYLGGGVRGAIFASGFGKEIPVKIASVLTELGALYVKRYGELDGADEEPAADDWDAKATKAARAAGIRSAY